MVTVQTLKAYILVAVYALGTKYLLSVDLFNSLARQDKGGPGSYSLLSVDKTPSMLAQVSIGELVTRFTSHQLARIQPTLNTRLSQLTKAVSSISTLTWNTITMEHQALLNFTIMVSTSGEK